MLLLIFKLAALMHKIKSIQDDPYLGILRTPITSLFWPFTVKCILAAFNGPLSHFSLPFDTFKPFLIL
jgi:hypothetical protein